MVRLTDRPDMTLDVYRGRKTTMQQCNATMLKEHIPPTDTYFSIKKEFNAEPHLMLEKFHMRKTISKLAN